MSAGVCGKRVGFESSPTSGSANKRFRRSIRSSEFGFWGSEDKLSHLMNMFPSMNRELVESVLNNHNQKVEDAVESLQKLLLGEARMQNESSNSDSMVSANNSDVQGAESSQLPDQKVEELQENDKASERIDTANWSSWVDMFVQEMMTASDMDDARLRATRMLEAFERSIVAHLTDSDRQLELASLKEHLQGLLKDNQILKRAVAIQHVRNSEQEEKLKEVEHLKHMINQYQDQLRTLEINNYTLKLHLQRAQESSSIPGNFHPDIF
ncbi:hypothetical protein IFM89_013465 [Coptis chinensis]|uniref:CUE domain-containing protein n=1 Tax=Coptis chinensis TaxID=261450 RepID=A0A835HJZ0_9MAGN|nr:hypothetical protein IFM89_013465 [Coptis chinensis]